MPIWEPRCRRRQAQLPMSVWLSAIPVMIVVGAVALVAFAVIAAAEFATFAWATSRGREATAPPSARADRSEATIAELRDRYVRGEIELDEYERRLTSAIRLDAARRPSGKP